MTIRHLFSILCALLFGVCVSSAISGSALASSRTSANYSITTETVDWGGNNVQSAAYSLPGSAVGELGSGSPELVTTANYPDINDFILARAKFKMEDYL